MIGGGSGCGSTPVLPSSFRSLPRVSLFDLRRVSGGGGGGTGAISAPKPMQSRGAIAAAKLGLRPVMDGAGAPQGTAVGKNSALSWVQGSGYEEVTRIQNANGAVSVKVCVWVDGSFGQSQLITKHQRETVLYKYYQLENILFVNF